MKLVQWQPQPNRKTQLFWVKGFWLVPNGHTLTGFAIGALRLATMAALHNTNSCASIAILISFITKTIPFLISALMALLRSSFSVYEVLSIYNFGERLW